MKVLLLHVDYIKFKPLKKALKNIDGISPNESKLGGEVKNALAVLTAVESYDKDVKKVVKNLVDNIKDVSSKVNTKNIVIYPYAHLSRDLASPKLAVDVLKTAEKELKKTRGFKVVRAPFGYYKEFELKVKGHPLAELSREIKTESSSKGKKGEEVEEDVDTKQLLREIGKSKLDRSKLRENDHRVLGQVMDLFSFSETAPGMVFWHDGGLIIYSELTKYLREELRLRNYKEIKTPQILDKKLWVISGHWNKYKENIFLTNYEGRRFAAKPMSCPGVMIVYKSSPKSYKELPLRVAEFGLVHRQELSGVLAGLFRVIEFTQDDAHIFCTEKQIESEVKNIMELIEKVYRKFGFKYLVELSTRPKKRIGSDKIWDKSEKALENVLKKNKIRYKLNKGDGAFYGPKIDFHLKDSLGRTWQCGTIQLDFSMPERFQLEYTDKDNRVKRPVMLHRTIFGSVERFIGVLLEHLNGRLPTWLSPIQVRVINFTDRNNKYAEKVVSELKKKLPSLRVDTDIASVPLNGKIRNAELMRIPYIVVVGDAEEKNKTLAVRSKGKKKIDNLSIDKFTQKLKKEIDNRE